MIMKEREVERAGKGEREGEKGGVETEIERIRGIVGCGGQSAY